MIVYEGRDIRVVARLFEEDKSNLVITFTGRAAAPPVEKGFGESYLIKRRASAIHFISKDNHWWQTPEAMEAVAELQRRGWTAADRRITLYGSSMGGYAALMLSGLIKPRRLVLFSPQFSIDPKRVPFEKRWRAYAARLSFDYDDMAACVDHEAEVKVVYDPFFKPDRQHVELIEGIRPVEHVHIRFAGHNTARALGELGIITRVIDGLLFGDITARDFEQLYRQSRAASSLYWYGLSQALARHGHRAGAMLAAAAAAKILLDGRAMKDRVLRLDILRWTISQACDSNMLELARTCLAELETLENSTSRAAYFRALIARAEDNWLEADAQADAAAGRKRNNPLAAALKIETTSRATSPEAAMDMLKALPEAARRAPPVLRSEASALADAGQWTAAIKVLQRYFRHERLDPQARALSARCWRELGQADVAVKQLNPILHYHIASDRLFAEIVQLVESERGPRHAEKLRGRHKRFRRIFASTLASLNATSKDDRAEL
jgi:hypothetical protein